MPQTTDEKRDALDELKVQAQELVAGFLELLQSARNLEDDCTREEDDIATEARALRGAMEDVLRYFGAWEP